MEKTLVKRGPGQESGVGFAYKFSTFQASYFRIMDVELADMNMVIFYFF